MSGCLRYSQIALYSQASLLIAKWSRLRLPFQRPREGSTQTICVPGSVPLLGLIFTTMDWTAA